MTFDDMRNEAEILFESITSDTAPGFTDSEWGTIFTVAQRRIVLGILKEGIARNALTALQLNNLLVYDTITDLAKDTFYYNSDGSFADTVDATLDNFSEKVFWILDEYVASANYDRIPLLRKTYDYYQKNLPNPFAKPDVLEGFWAISVKDSTYADPTNRPVFIGDGTVLTGYKYIGVEHPDYYAISSGNDCILHESIQGDIVAEAVKLAHKSVLDPQGYQMAVTEEQLKN